LSKFSSEKIIFLNKFLWNYPRLQQTVAIVELEIDV